MEFLQKNLPQIARPVIFFHVNQNHYIATAAHLAGVKLTVIAVGIGKGNPVENFLTAACEYLRPTQLNVWAEEKPFENMNIQNETVKLLEE